MYKYLGGYVKKNTFFFNNCQKYNGLSKYLLFFLGIIQKNSNNLKKGYN